MCLRVSVCVSVYIGECVLRHGWRERVSEGAGASDGMGGNRSDDAN